MPRFTIITKDNACLTITAQDVVDARLRAVCVYDEDAIIAIKDTTNTPQWYVRFSTSNGIKQYILSAPTESELYTDLMRMYGDITVKSLARLPESICQ